jgi:hypothetical protein
MRSPVILSYGAALYTKAWQPTVLRRTEWRGTCVSEPRTATMAMLLRSAPRRCTAACRALLYGAAKKG